MGSPISEAAAVAVGGKGKRFLRDVFLGHGVVDDVGSVHEGHINQQGLFQETARYCQALHLKHLRYLNK